MSDSYIYWVGTAAGIQPLAYKAHGERELATR
jgi:hypothetical protein